MDTKLSLITLLTFVVQKSYCLGADAFLKDEPEVLPKSVSQTRSKAEVA